MHLSAEPSPLHACIRGIGSNLEVVTLASEGVWQLHWCTCIDYVMNIKFIIGNGHHDNMITVASYHRYLCSYPGLKGPGNEASITADSSIYR